MFPFVWSIRWSALHADTIHEVPRYFYGESTGEYVYPEYDMKQIYAYFFEVGFTVASTEYVREQ